MAHLKGIAWWQWLPVWGWRVVVVAETPNDIPAYLPRNGAAVVESGGVQKWLAFDCPCRTGHRIMVSLDLRTYPYWRLSTADPLNVHPSIDFKSNVRRCHYFIRNGHVVWARGDYQ